MGQDEFSTAISRTKKLLTLKWAKCQFSDNIFLTLLPLQATPRRRQQSRYEPAKSRYRTTGTRKKWHKLSL